MDNSYNDNLRTHRRLRKAYTVLLSRKNYKDISVKELTEYAEMSRAAFYLHFDSIEDFSFECSQYLIKKITSQMIFWLDGGSEAVVESCRKRNLIIDETDRELFGCYLSQEIYFPGKSSFDTIVPMYCEFLNRRFGLTEEECRSNGKLMFFIRAFSASIMDSVADYNSKNMARDMKYVFMIWDQLFPEYKL